MLAAQVGPGHFSPQELPQSACSRSQQVYGRPSLMFLLVFSHCAGRKVIEFLTTTAEKFCNDDVFDAFKAKYLSMLTVSY